MFIKEKKNQNFKVRMAWEEFLSYYENKEPLYIEGEPFIFTRKDFLTLKSSKFLLWNKPNMRAEFHIVNKK